MKPGCDICKGGDKRQGRAEGQRPGVPEYFALTAPNGALVPAVEGRLHRLKPPLGLLDIETPQHLMPGTIGRLGLRLDMGPKVEPLQALPDTQQQTRFYHDATPTYATTDKQARTRANSKNTPHNARSHGRGAPLTRGRARAKNAAPAQSLFLCPHQAEAFHRR